MPDPGGEFGQVLLLACLVLWALLVLFLLGAWLEKRQQRVSPEEDAEVPKLAPPPPSPAPPAPQGMRGVSWPRFWFRFIPWALGLLLSILGFYLLVRLVKWPWKG
jgi:hypothetical protein